MHDLSPSPHTLPISPEEIARLAACVPAARWHEAIETGIAEARGLIVPRARWVEVEPPALGILFAGETPVAPIASRGKCRAFVATIGDALEARVRDHLASGRYLEGILLDAAGSVAVESVCDQVERGCAGDGPSARFSPGYCMWPLESQRRLFALLQPEEIGVTLLPSMLMQPLKSVSGLVVEAALSEDLDVPAEDCAQCDATGCARRGAIG